MEYWDLYDKDRKPLGRTHLRGDVFNEGEYYVCCEVWVINSEGKLLTTKRHPDKKAGNLWEFVGGGTLAGETTKQSAVLQPDEAIDAKWSTFEDIDKMIAGEEFVYTVGKRFDAFRDQI